MFFWVGIQSGFFSDLFLEVSSSGWTLNRFLPMYESFISNCVIGNGVQIGGYLVHGVNYGYGCLGLDVDVTCQRKLLFP